MSHRTIICLILDFRIWAHPEVAYSVLHSGVNIYVNSIFTFFNLRCIHLAYPITDVTDYLWYIPLQSYIAFVKLNTSLLPNAYNNSQNHFIEYIAGVCDLIRLRKVYNHVFKQFEETIILLGGTFFWFFVCRLEQKLDSLIWNMIN